MGHRDVDAHAGSPDVTVPLAGRDWVFSYLDQVPPGEEAQAALSLLVQAEEALFIAEEVDLAFDGRELVQSCSEVLLAKVPPDVVARAIVTARALIGRSVRDGADPKTLFLQLGEMLSYLLSPRLGDCQTAWPPPHVQGKLEGFLSTWRKMAEASAIGVGYE